MRDKVLDTIEKYEMIGQGDHVCAAVSGGADSAALLSFLLSLLPPEPQKTAPMEQSAGSGAHVSVLIENLMDNILNGSDAQSLTRDERLEKIRFMDEKGLFLMKGSVEKAAEKLGVGKVTIYSYLDEVRGKRG